MQVKLTAHGATGAEADGWRKMITSDYQVEQLRTSVKLEFPANVRELIHVPLARWQAFIVVRELVSWIGGGWGWGLCE